ncbi:MAG: 3-phosphoserine/phosphohydroxythreonine transaminase [Lentisphaeria bacterium]|nr:3-phosphoserine/phosphohydroxythreonine transaminase [Lentisphaeria bacterium]
MTNPVYNFSAGPATLPKEVMLKAQAEFVDFRGIGFGLIEASHRGPAFQQIIDEAEADLREIAGIPDTYSVLFLQGGASTQFAMIPMNLMVDGKPALYADTGAWAAKALKEAKLFGDARAVFSGKQDNYTTIAPSTEWEGMTGDAAYLYICSNNTIFGTQYHDVPEIDGVPLIADMSSDILCRPFDVNKFGMFFAGAQKNLGPAGVTVVVIRKDLAERAKASIPTMLNYNTHIDTGSMFNTPPVFAIYMVGLVLKWIKEKGGLAAMDKANRAKAALLYDFIDHSDAYYGPANPANRSLMNVTFRLNNPDLEPAFIEQASAIGLKSLKGHRSVGGMRASIYNAMPKAGVEKLVEFMADFAKKNA